MGDSRGVWKERAETFFDSSEYEIIRQLVLGRNTKCDQSSETSALAVLSYDAVCLVFSSNVEFVDEILWYGHLNETSSSVLSYGAIYLVNHAVFGQRFYYSVTQPFAYIFNCTICFPTFEKLKLGYSFSYIQII